MVQRIFVGDLQGCADELDALLERARGEFGDRFELWAVGDLVNRGPDNLGVLRALRELADAGRATVVLGNHDIGLLALSAGLRQPQPGDTSGDVLADPDAAQWLEWLRTRPLAARGQLGEQPFAMVHASVHPEWDLPALEGWARRVEARLGDPDGDAVRAFLQRPADDALRDALGRFTRARSVTAGGAWSSDYPDPSEGRVAWHRAWAERDHGYGLVYGHWARQGLHVAPFLRGLDTGCVHGGAGPAGALTAWLPDPAAARPFDVPDERFWRIPARRRYYVSPDPPRGPLRKKGD